MVGFRRGIIEFTGGVAAPIACSLLALAI